MQVVFVESAWYAVDGGDGHEVGPQGLNVCNVKRLAFGILLYGSEVLALLVTSETSYGEFQVARGTDVTSPRVVGNCVGETGYLCVHGEDGRFIAEESSAYDLCALQSRQLMQETYVESAWRPNIALFIHVLQSEASHMVLAVRFGLGGRCTDVKHLVFQDGRGYSTGGTR
ncbi:hypothetical protein Efla_007891 [Eimeria flavescens]